MPGSGYSSESAPFTTSSSHASSSPQELFSIPLTPTTTRSDCMEPRRVERVFRTIAADVEAGGRSNQCPKTPSSASRVEDKRKSGPPCPSSPSLSSPPVGPSPQQVTSTSGMIHNKRVVAPVVDLCQPPIHSDEFDTSDVQPYPSNLPVDTTLLEEIGKSITQINELQVSYGRWC